MVTVFLPTPIQFYSVNVIMLFILLFLLKGVTNGDHKNVIVFQLTIFIFIYLVKQTKLS